MKSPFFTIVLALLLFPQLLSAQNTSFLDFSQWFLTEVNPQGSSFDWYQTGKDSTINGEEYYQALFEYTPLPIWVREDLTTQRVYVVAPWDGWNERLMYDFALGMGDTTALTFREGGTMRFEVVNIDAVNTAQGFIPRINLNNIDGTQPASLQWSPGVGAFSNPFYLDLSNDADTTFMLICNYHDGAKLWDDGFGTCPGVPPPLSAVNYSFTKSPTVTRFSDRFEVQMPSGHSWDIRVFEMYGKTILERTLKGGSRQVFGKGFEKGIFFIQVIGRQETHVYRWLSH